MTTNEALGELHFRSGFNFNGYKNSVKEGNPYLTFPGTNFLYLPAKMSFEDIKDRFDVSKIRVDFWLKIERIIKKMLNEYGIAFGVFRNENYVTKDGETLDPSQTYRTFKEQHEILSWSLKEKPWRTNAGPGESWHNYGYAVDLGVMQWIDTSGNEYGPKGYNDKKEPKEMIRDFWLANLKKIDSLAFNEIWKMRNWIEDTDVYNLNSEKIHLQMFPPDKSAPDELIKLLNACPKDSNDSLWEYQKAGVDKTTFEHHKLNQYKCNFGESNFYIAGTAHQLWSGDKTGIQVSPDQVTVETIPDEGIWEKNARIQLAVEKKKEDLAARYPKIKTHMVEAEKLAKTHIVST